MTTATTTTTTGERLGFRELTHPSCRLATHAVASDALPELLAEVCLVGMEGWGGAPEPRRVTTHNRQPTVLPMESVSQPEP